MNKENIISPIILAGIFIAFVIVSLLLWAWGNNKRMVSSKLKLGAAILTLTTLITTNSYSQKTCYKPAYPDEIININKRNEENTIELKSNDKYITGSILNLRSTRYFYAIVDDDLGVMKEGEVKANDGEFDEDKESFKIDVDSVTIGKYKLKIYRSEENKNNGQADYVFDLKISATKKDQPDVLCYYY